MKREKIKYILLIMLIGMTILMPQAYAATSIEIKPNASTVYTNKTISEFFDESMAMKNVGEGLEGSDVDVHMATNMDWAIFSYFSNSQYGTNGEGKNDGLDVTIGGTTYKSTNGNITGMMNLGKTTTYTSGVTRNYANILDTSTENASGKSIIANATNNNYVDLIWKDDGLRKKMAFNAWFDVYYPFDYEYHIPYTIRNGLFIGSTAEQYYGYKQKGAAYSNITFRPVIWNGDY